MVRGKSRAAQSSTGKAAWNTTFVDIPLTGHTWEDLEAWCSDPEQLFEFLTTLLEDGYRVGFSYNPQNDAFICSVTCREGESVNLGKTFTAFAGTWYEALKVALYKHNVVAEKKWVTGSPGADRPRFG